MIQMIIQLVTAATGSGGSRAAATFLRHQPNGINVAIYGYRICYLGMDEHSIQ